MSRSPNAQDFRIGPRDRAGTVLPPNTDPVRVILVGKTGLDSVLRSDRAVELLRAKTALDAIGELADPIDESSPRSSAVVLAPGAVEPARAGAFADALRTLEPEVRVLNLGPVPLPGLDGNIAQNADPHTIRRAVRPLTGSSPVHGWLGGEANAGAAGQVEVRYPSDPQGATGFYDNNHQAASPLPRPAPVPPAPSSDFDRAVLTAVLSGKDAAAAALAHIAERTGAAPRYIAAPAVPPPEEARASAAVVYATRTLGYLVAPGLDPGTLAGAAAALAPWLLLAAQHDQLKRAAFTDELTGAWNRRYFHRFLAAAIEHARVARHTVTLLSYDVDDFKKYNDAYGHAAGDEILTETVRLLNSVIRPTDRVCRIGGDEFAVIFHDPEGPRKPSAEGGGAPQTVAQIAARFQKQICEHRFPKLLDQAPGTLTISGGIATFPWDGATPQELLDRADALALQSKRLGKNVFTFGPGAERVCGIEKPS